VPKKFTDDEAEHMTQSACTTGYRSIAGRANYEVTKTVTDDHAVDRTVGDAPSNVCL